MKKSFWICALVLALSSANTANAQSVKKPMLKKSIKLEEIVLDINSPGDRLEEVGNVSMSGCAASVADENTSTQPRFIAGEDSSSLISSAEGQENAKPDLEKGFFNIFNLKGGVEKSPEEPQKAEVEETAVHKWLNGSYATGGWFGARPLLEEHGVTVNSSLLYSPFGMTRGGMADQVGGKGYSLYNLSVTVDTEKAGMWKGGTFYALYQNKRGMGLAGRAMGDYQVFDGWDFREMSQISEYWYQQKLFKDKLRLKFGKQDANMDFCFLNSGFDFMNLSHSVNPTVPIPTYPDQAFGFVAEIAPKEWISLKNGIYSKFGVPFNISEIELKPMIKKMPGRYILGAWEMSDSSGMDIPSGVDEYGAAYYRNFNRNFGAYAGFEQMVYKENKNDEKDMQGLIVFAQTGISPSNRNDMSRYVGGGLHYKGLIPKRDNDLAGIAVASGTFAPRLENMGADSRNGSETSLEVFYRAQITPWFYLQPDVQFIMNPGGAYDNSVAIGIRSVITF